MSQRLTWRQKIAAAVVAVGLVGAASLCTPVAVSSEINKTNLSHRVGVVTQPLRIGDSSPRENGVSLLAGGGELYTLDPDSKKITPLAPYLPPIDSGGAYYPTNQKRVVRVAKAYRQCQRRTLREEGNWCYYAKGLNYNALGVGPDGTRYATLKIGNSGTPYANGRGVSRYPLFQVYSLRPGSQEWEKYGSEFEFPAQQISGGERPDNLTFNGGQVAPDGTYYLSVTDKKGPSNQAKLVSHLFKMTPTGLQYVGEVTDANFNQGDTGSSDGDIVFTESGDLVIGFSILRADIPGNARPGVNRIDLTVVPKTALDRGNGGALESSLYSVVNIRKGEQKNEENSAIGATNGFAIGNDGSLISANFSMTSSTSSFYRYTDLHSNARILTKMPINGALGSYSNTTALPEWEPPLAKWQDNRDNSGGHYYTPVPWDSQITDMAGEAFIPSVVAHKRVNGRVSPADQFKIEVASKSISRYATTTGSANQIATQAIPALSGTQITVTEEIASGSSSLEEYEVSAQCIIGNIPIKNISAPKILGRKATVQFAVPSVSGNIDCTFVNTPKLSGQFEWAKESDDGQLLAGSQWTLARKDQSEFKVEGSSAPASSFDISDSGSGSEIDQNPNVGEFLVKGLKPGIYTLREKVAPAGFQRINTQYTFTIGSPALEVNKVHLYDGTAPVRGKTGRHNSIVNIPLTGVLTFEKRAGLEPATGNENLLGGSEWTLTNVRTREAITLTDCIDTQGSVCHGDLKDTDSRAGVFRVTGLKLGTYELREKKAPAGYVLNTTPRTFTIATKQLEHSFVGKQAILNHQLTGPTIPLTGGIGRDFYAIMGTGVLGLAVLAFLLRLRKQG
ncbi:MSCRAMM family protein [Arcanobacterium canis]